MGETMNSRTLAPSFPVSRSGKKRLDARLLLGTAAIALIASPLAHANPKDGSVTTGSAAISATSSKTTVDQKTEDVVINWSSFNIGTGQTTQFVQPNAQAIAVNRIGGASASQILGTLDANGRIVLINGNGMLFGKGSQVNVGSLIATSTDGSDSDLLAGKFTQAGNQNARIVNQGQIVVGTNGVVALVAPSVTNAGTVNAKLGTVTLGAANKFTVDFTGDGLVSFASQGDVTSRASAINTGLLSGANVSMTAHAANSIATGVVNMSGIILAQGVQNVGGTIYLDAGNGTLTTTGTLNAAGATGGGQIETSGHVANISGTITAGKGGLWKVDPEDLTIDSNTVGALEGALDADTSVLEQTTSGNATGYGTTSPGGQGDINVDTALTWSTNATLTLDAYHSINILAPISITGGGGLVLQYNDAATDGVLSFGLGSSGFAGSVSYAVGTGEGIAGQSLTINGATYTLVYSSTDLQNINNNLNDNYALANGLDASSVSNWVPLGVNSSGAVQNSNNGFNGAFEGLGNTISNFTVNDSVDTYLGLFGYAGSASTIRDVALAGGSVTSTIENTYVGALVGEDDGLILNVQSNLPVSSTWAEVGGIVGYLTGTIENSSSSGNVTGDVNTDAGGLVGYNDGGNILSSSASGTVSVTFDANAGGLLGYNYIGVVSNSYATGTASATDNAYTGGLVGYQYKGSISASHASGAASVTEDAYAGGLVGYDDEAPITGSYATGAVSGTQEYAYIGGLAGYDYEGTITGSYATGAVTASDGYDEAGGLLGYLYEGTIQGTYATGTVTAGSGDAAGGLVGTSFGTIEQSFATGAVTGGSGSEVGGLAGENDATIEEAYATGAVGGTGAAAVGGLVGVNALGATISQTYATGYVAPGSGTNIGGFVGTDNASAGGITSSYWDIDTSGISTLSQGAGNTANDSGITGKSTTTLQGALPGGFDNTVWGTGAGLYPYFLWQYPSGTPQTITGTSYTDTGATVDAGDMISGLLDGNSIGTASTGANGYYYFLLAPGSLGGTDAVYVQSATGATVADDLGASRSGVDIWGGYFRDFTAESFLSNAGDNVDYAIGNDAAAETFSLGLSNQYIVSSATSFSVDAELGNSGDTTVKTTNGDLYVTAAQAWATSGTLTFDSADSLYVLQSIQIGPGADLSLITNDGSFGPVPGGTGNLVFEGGNAFFPDAPASGLTINGQAYTLVTNVTTLASDVAAAPSGFYALALSYDAGADGIYVQAVVPTTLTGTFEGLGNTISNLTIDAGSGSAGLFATVGSTGFVRDVGLLDVNISGGGGAFDGALAGVNYGNIFGSFASGSVSTGFGTRTGGLVGFNSGGAISQSFANDLVEAQAGSDLGGLVGYNTGTISQSYASGAVTGDHTTAVGGFVGYNQGTISVAYSTGAVAAIDSPTATLVGGFVGNNAGGTIDESYAAGVVSPDTATTFGAFAGTNNGTIGGTVDDYYDKGTSPGMAAVGGGTGTAPGLFGLTAAQFLNHANFTGWTFGGLGSGADWVIVDNNSTLNNSAGTSGGTLPFLTMEYSTAISNENQLQLMALNLTQSYYLIDSLTYDGAMWGAKGFVPVGNTINPFEGGLFGSYGILDQQSHHRPADAELCRPVRLRVRMLGNRRRDAQWRQRHRLGLCGCTGRCG